MTKEYIENYYRLAVLDFEMAHDDDGKFQAMRTMARLEHIASQIYGFEYAGYVHGFLDIYYKQARGATME